MNEIKFKFIIDKFEKSYEKILMKILSSIRDEILEEYKTYLRNIYDYNIYNGKRIRAYIFIKVFCFLTENYDEESEEVILLAWCLEIIETVAVIIDDILDGGEKRRGKLCWYKKVSVL